MLCVCVYYNKPGYHGIEKYYVYHGICITQDTHNQLQETNQYYDMMSYKPYDDNEQEAERTEKTTRQHNYMKGCRAERHPQRDPARSRLRNRTRVGMARSHHAV